METISVRSRFKVLIIATNQEREPYPVYPLGASLIASVLEAGGAEVRGLDLAFAEDPAREAADAALEFGPDAIAVSVRAVDNVTFLDPRYYVPDCARIVTAARDACNAPVIVGGSGYSLFPVELLTLLLADYGIRGEGEASIVRVCGSLRSGLSVEPGDGVYARRGEEVRGGGVAPLLAPGLWSEPAYDVFPLRPYLDAGGTASIQTKRGCGQSCTYCTYPILEGRTTRARDPLAVARDVAGATEQGADYVYFVDSTFNLPAPHALAVCREIAALGAAFQWTAFLTPLGFDPPLPEAMARAGCRSAELGSEAGSAVTLRGMGKTHAPEDIVVADRSLQDAGITPAHYMVFGGPDETRDTVEETLDLIERLSGVVVAMVGLRVYPGTSLHDRARLEGLDVDEAGMVRPTYYVSRTIDLDRLLARLAEFAEAHPRFFVVGLSPNPKQPILDRLRERGRRGPLWEFYNLAG